MPNPKVGTVTADVETAVKNAKAGQVRYRTDKAGIIHCPIGRADFEVPALKENLEALLADLKKAKPAAAKGQYVKKLTVSSTMGPGVSVDRGVGRRLISVKEFVEHWANRVRAKERPDTIAARTRRSSKTVGDRVDRHGLNNRLRRW